MSSTYTPNIYLEQPGLGDYVNTWNTPVNSDWAVIDQVFGSSTTVSFTNTNVTLTVAESAYFMIVCTGTLTGNVELILPGTIGGSRQVFNQCVGAYTLTVLNGSGDTGGGVVCGQGFITSVVLTAGQAYYDVYASTPPGVILPYGGIIPPPGFLLCYGQTVSQTTYAALYAVLGTTWGASGGGNFTLPDLRGNILAGADNMGGSPAGRLTGYTVGSSGGSQVITLTSGEVPSLVYTDSGHSHTASDSGHTHGPGAGTYFLSTPGPGGLTGGPSEFYSESNSTATGFASISVGTGHASVTDNAGGGSHPNVQPTAAVNYMIRF